MKNLFAITLMIIMISGVMFAQTFKYSAYKVKVVVLETNESVVDDVDIIMTLTGYSLKFSSGAVFYFTSGLINTSSTQGYAFAEDADGKKCRVWFQAFSKTDTNIGIEYGDVGIIYQTIRIK